MKLKQEDRQLLLKDLSARLPYNPMVHIHELGGIDYENYLYADDLDRMMSYSITLKPYLRPMSSMTEEEKKEYKHFVAFSGSSTGSAKFVDWLNAHHFDYRGLIEKNLALKTPEGMYK